MDLCSFKNKDIFDWIYLKNLTREECESNMKKFEDPEPHRYVIPLNVTSDVSLNFIPVPSLEYAEEIINQSTCEDLEHNSDKKHLRANLYNILLQTLNHLVLPSPLLSYVPNPIVQITIKYVEFIVKDLFDYFCGRRMFLLNNFF